MTDRPDDDPQPTEPGDEKPPPSGDPSRSAVGGVWAFLPIGVAFMVIGMTQGLGDGGTAFFVIGISFMVIAFAGGARGRSRGGDAPTEPPTQPPPRD